MHLLLTSIVFNYLLIECWESFIFISNLLASVISAFIFLYKKIKSLNYSVAMILFINTTQYFIHCLLLSSHSYQNVYYVCLSLINGDGMICMWTLHGCFSHDILILVYLPFYLMSPTNEMKIVRYTQVEEFFSLIAQTCTRLSYFHIAYLQSN